MLTTDTVSLKAFLAFPHAFRSMVNLIVIRYEGLQLQNHRLDSLGRLPSLKQLRLKDCGLQNLGFLTAFVGGAPLEDIDVASNAISALPPRTAFRRRDHPSINTLSQCQDDSTVGHQKQTGTFPLSLRTLDLSDNAIEDVNSLEALAEFPNLEVLRLFGNNLNNDLAFNSSFTSKLRSCTQLQRSVNGAFAYVSCPGTPQPPPTVKDAQVGEAAELPRYEAGTGLLDELRKKTLGNIGCDKETQYEQVPAVRLPSETRNPAAAAQVSSESGAGGTNQSLLVKEECPHCAAQAEPQQRAVTVQPEQRDTNACPAYQFVPKQAQTSFRPLPVMCRPGKAAEAALRSQQQQCYLAAFQRDIQASAHLERCNEHLIRLQRARRAFIAGLHRLTQTSGTARLYEQTATALAQLESIRHSLPAVNIPGATGLTIRILQAAQDYSPGGLAARAGSVSSDLRRQVITLEKEVQGLLLLFEDDVLKSGKLAMLCRSPAASTVECIPLQSEISRDVLDTKLVTRKEST
uniref:Leucine rich repeat protein, putative n=1 Tax=Neospora caninum (strain Liverpool) TaxID=572307 RepID=A0A0F7UDK2_NEOCL|nr:TPA: leucine rich repeat protein, putative [Neospora caninum Liverpool]